MERINVEEGLPYLPSDKDSVCHNFFAPVDSKLELGDDETLIVEMPKDAPRETFVAWQVLTVRTSVPVDTGRRARWAKLGSLKVSVEWKSSAEWRHYYFRQR
jgi:hypothetical protein